MVYHTMDEALIQVGLPVKCRKCMKHGYVKAGSDYNGWYKSKMFRFQALKWYCPEHYEIGREVDNKFYENYKTPDPYTEDELEKTEEELYKLID